MHFLMQIPGGGREQRLFTVTIPSIPLNSNPGILSMSRSPLFTDLLRMMEFNVGKGEKFKFS